MDIPHSPRKPFLAAAMSFMLPGLGQLYNGEANKAIWIFLSFALLSLPGLVLVALYLPAVLMVPALGVEWLATIAIWIYGMADAYRCARRRQAYVLKAWQVSGAYVLTFLLCNGVALPLIIGYVRAHQVAAYNIPSSSMEPSVLRGDVLFADMRYNCPGCKGAVKRGDLAIFTYPNNRTLSYIKRVIALPGDRVRIAGRAVFVNDQPLTVRESEEGATMLVTEAVDGQQWQVRWPRAANSARDAQLTVPAGHAFVLGDNRATSTDGRDFGPVPLQDIVGRARQIWFSRAQPDGVRWSRLGKVLE